MTWIPEISNEILYKAIEKLIDWVYPVEITDEYKKMITGLQKLAEYSELFDSFLKEKGIDIATFLTDEAPHAILLEQLTLIRKMTNG